MHKSNVRKDRQALARAIAEQMVEVMVERGLVRPLSPQERTQMERSSDELLEEMRGRAMRNAARAA